MPHSLSFAAFLHENNIVSPDQVFNCVGSGFPLQSISSKKVCVEKAMKRAFHLGSCSKTSITTLQCISASGYLIPPPIYYPGKNLNSEYCLGFPKNYYLGFSDSGWMERYHFYGWVTNHFVKQIPAKRPVLLLVDGHLSHISYDTSLFCKENGKFLFKLPPHTSHVLQPADRGFFIVLKGEWKKVCTAFTIENPGFVVTKRTFSRVFVTSFDRAARTDVVQAAFKCSGIWPVNRFAIDDSAFAPAKTFSIESISDAIDQQPDPHNRPSRSAKPVQRCRKHQHQSRKFILFKNLSRCWNLYWNPRG